MDIELEDDLLAGLVEEIERTELSISTDPLTYDDDDDFLADMERMLSPSEAPPSRTTVKQLRWRDGGPEDINGRDGGLEDVQRFHVANPANQLGALGQTTPPESPQPQGDAVTTKSLIWKLYASHLMSKWGSRMWEFAIALFFIGIWPGSLVLVAAFGLVESITALFTGTVIGDWVDKAPRLTAVRRALFCMNGAVAISATILATLLNRLSAACPDTLSNVRKNNCFADNRDSGFWMLAILVMVSGAVVRMADMASTLAVEKDWVKVIVGGSSELLAETNAVMRRIDLVCKILAPVMVGFIMTYMSPLSAAVFMGVWNVVLVVPEYKMLYGVHTAFPALQQPRDVSNDQNVANRSLLSVMMTPVTTLRNGWTRYVQQSVFRPALALALLYCTVLSFGSVMTAYANHRGMSEAALSIARGAGALFGLIATFLYPRLHRRMGVVKTGVLSIWAQLCLLVLCVIGVSLSGRSGDCSTLAYNPHQKIICLEERNLELGLLITGVIVSRMGLWMFDLAVSQVLQERVANEMLATVNGAQGSMQEGFGLLIGVLCIVFSNPDQFSTLVYVSFCATLLAALLYTSWWQTTQGGYVQVSGSRSRDGLGIQLLGMANGAYSIASNSDTSDDDDGNLYVEDDDDDDDDDPDDDDALIIGTNDNRT